MATRTENEITLSHEEADTLVIMLANYMNRIGDVARNTKVPAVRSAMVTEANAIRVIRDRMVRDLYTWND